MTARSGACIVTKEHRRFVEFATAVRRHRTIGLCFGPAGVGKTLSARRYAHWDEAEPMIEGWGLSVDACTALEEKLARTRTVFHTPTITGTLRDLRDTMGQSLVLVSACIEAASMSPASSTAPSGLPEPGRGANTSSCR